MGEKSRQRIVHIICSFVKKEDMEGRRKKEKDGKNKTENQLHTRGTADSVKTHKNVIA